MTGRIAPPSDPVTITLDGEAIVAARGEPVAASLLAAGKLALARSPKFHRPRGPSCMRAACDGCLARVNGVPNVMTCRVPAEEGLAVASQNTLGSREVDLLRVTDWFFPAGFNHHELLAGVPGAQKLMQLFARRVAGLGKLPADVSPPKSGSRRDADVVIVGAGAAGMSVAIALAEKGRTIEVIDDALVPGGSLRALAFDADAKTRAPWRELLARFDAYVAGGAVRLRVATTAAAIYDDDLLVVDESGAEIVTARALVLATGAHDGVLAFEGNDLPGVLSARAAAILLSHGVHLGKRVLVVVAPGGDLFGEAYFDAASRLTTGSSIELAKNATLLRASGTARVKRVTLRTGERETTHDVDALVIDAPRAAAYELCAQAGARLEHESSGYVPRTDAGKIRDGVWVSGEASGTRLEASAIARDAESIAAQILGP